MEKVRSWIIQGLGLCWIKVDQLMNETKIAKRVVVVDHGVCDGQKGRKDRRVW